MSDKVYIIGDIGSCHLGKLQNCLKAVKVGKEAGLDAVKFQIGVQKPNLDIKFDWLVKAKELGDKIGIDVFTSCFDNKYTEDIIKLKPKYMKFAYSQCKGGDGDLSDYCTYALAVAAKADYASVGIKVIASCDVMTYPLNAFANVKLYCVPEYPVRYWIDFDGLFPNFDGFSDHTLGIWQTLHAVSYGARFIEKHFKIREGIHEDSPPDERFALGPNALKRMVEGIRVVEKDKDGLKTKSEFRNTGGLKDVD
jgi:N-acetylneuraminate synthase